MAKRPMKAAGVSGKGGNDRRKSSPLAPTSLTAPVRMSVDDASSKVVKGTLRPKPSGVGGSDAALGTKGVRSRTAATAASAQFRITSKLPGPTSPEAAKTLANGKILPPVMGQSRNFAAGSMG